MFDEQKEVNGQACICHPVEVVAVTVGTERHPGEWVLETHPLVIGPDPPVSGDGNPVYAPGDGELSQ
jgi:hypothetical protein